MPSSTDNGGERLTPLAAVSVAAERRLEAIDAYRRAVVAAYEHGHSLVAIAKAAGVTRQAIHQQLSATRDPR